MEYYWADLVPYAALSLQELTFDNDGYVQIMKPLLMAEPEIAILTKKRQNIENYSDFLKLIQ